MAPRDEPRRRRVAIVESNHTGHRLYFVRLLVEEAERRGDEVLVLLSGDATASDEYELHLRRVEGLFEVHTLARGTREPRLAALRRIARDLRTDLVVVPDGDRVARSMALSRRWSGPGSLTVLVLREKSQSKDSAGKELLTNVIKSAIYRWADRGRNARVVLLKTALWRGTSRLATANDPVTMTATAASIGALRTELGLDTSRHWFAVLGVVDERKNLPLVARSLAALKGRDIGLVVAGQCSPSVLSAAEEGLTALRSTGAPVVLVNRMLSDLELDSIVGAVDTVVMAHSNEGSSGLFGKAAAAGTRIVAAGSKTLRDDINAFPELGQWSRLDDSEMTAAFARSLGSASVRVPRTPGTASFTTPLLDTGEGRA